MVATAGTTKNKILRLFLPVVVAGLLLTVHLYDPARPGLWMNVFFDSLHVPVFGVIALCTYAVLPDNYSIRWRVAAALAISFFLGLLSEFGQVFTSRDASVHDLISDAAGATGFVLAALAISRANRISTINRSFLAIIAASALGYALLPLCNVSIAYIQRNSQFPVLSNFGSLQSDHLTRTQNLRLEILQSNDTNEKFAMATFESGPWPGVAFHDIYPDWRNYSTLVLELLGPHDSAIQLNFRVHDRTHNDTYSDRFNYSFQLNPGLQELRIELDEIRRAPLDRDMNMAVIDEIILFGLNSDAGRSFYIRQIRLE